MKFENEAEEKKWDTIKSCFYKVAAFCMLVLGFLISCDTVINLTGECIK